MTMIIPSSQPMRVAPTAGQMRPVAISRPSASMVSVIVGNCAGLTMPVTVIACQAARTITIVAIGRAQFSHASRLFVITPLLPRPDRIRG